MDASLTAETSRQTGTRAVRRLRAAGKIPGVVYGLGTESRPVTVEWPDLRRALSTDAGLNALIDLSVDGDTRLSMVKDLQRDPVRRTVTHVDFQLIDPDVPLTVEVPVALVGTSPALEALRGMVDQLRHTMTVQAKPGSIPNALEADVSEIEIGSVIKAADIALPAGVTSAMDPDTVIAQGSATRSTLLLQGKISEDEFEAGEGAGTGGGDQGETAEAASDAAEGE